MRFSRMSLAAAVVAGGVALERVAVAVVEEDEPGTAVVTAVVSGERVVVAIVEDEPDADVVVYRGVQIHDLSTTALSVTTRVFVGIRLNVRIAAEETCCDSK